MLIVIVSFALPLLMVIVFDAIFPILIPPIGIKTRQWWNRIVSELTVTLGRLDRAISRNQRGADEVLLLKLADVQIIFCLGILVKVFNR